MKKVSILAFVLALSLGMVCNAFAAIKYVPPYVRTDGTPVTGCFKDTSHDGNPYNNANYLGLNGR